MRAFPHPCPKLVVKPLVALLNLLPQQGLGGRVLPCGSRSVPAEFRLLLRKGPVLRLEPGFLQLGLCPEVPFGSPSEAFCKELATHVPASRTHSLPSAKSPDVRRVSAQERNG